MNIMIIGSGGREHALAECFARSSGVSGVLVAPGNAGIALQYECLPLTNHSEIKDYCQKNDIGLVFIGAEQPIAEGLSDYLSLAGIAVLAPSKFAAQLETSKIFAKELMLKKGVPTAKFRVVNTSGEADSCLSEFCYPVVVKEDGLAAGKGVIIAYTYEEAVSAVQALFSGKNPASSLIPDRMETHKGVIVEEFLQGWEVSLFAVTDGNNFSTTIFAQDHKQIYDGDLGPNTGGMGAYAPVPEAEGYRQQIEEEIISPILAAMRELGHPYKGILYCGLMITSAGPKVIEFNCRLGDPEAEVLLPLLETDLLELCLSVVNNDVYYAQVKFKNSTALGVVKASGGYPGLYSTGFPISLPDPLPKEVYFSGVVQGEAGLETSGGRVLCAVGIGESLMQAQQKAYQKLAGFYFEAETYRKDIGNRKNCL